MGMYTELIFGANCKADLLNEIDLAVLQYLFNNGPEPIVLPDHPFFKCDRWKYITKSLSYYFAVRSPYASIKHDKISETWNLSSRANLKNYDSEIEKFLDWIKPKLEQGSGYRDFYAIVCYEEQDEPTIYYLKEKES